MLTLRTIIRQIFGPKHNWKFIIDDKGLVSIDYGYLEGTYVGKQQNPVWICEKSFEYYNDYLKNKNDIKRKYFLNCSNWIIENAKQVDNYSVLESPFPFPLYNTPPFWRDSMAQGYAIQNLINAHKITNRQKYLSAAKSLLNAFFIDVKDGGVTHKTTNSGWWYEHYAHPEGKFPRVLNAHMYALLGIEDFFKYTNDSEAKYLFSQGISALIKNLSSYDLNGLSYYDAFGLPADQHYHKIHILQTKKLYEITKKRFFLDFHEKWKNLSNMKRLWEYNKQKVKNLFKN